MELQHSWVLSPLRFSTHFSFIQLENTFFSLGAATWCSGVSGVPCLLYYIPILSPGAWNLWLNYWPSTWLVRIPVFLELSNPSILIPGFFLGVGRNNLCGSVWFFCLATPTFDLDCTKSHCCYCTSIALQNFTKSLAEFTKTTWMSRQCHNFEVLLSIHA